MIINTCSRAISFARELENESGQFYKNLFLSFTKENGEYITQIERAFYGMITDAIEGCFAFNLNPEEYALKTNMEENEGYSDLINRATEVEEKIVKFYSDAAEQSKSLMADVRRTFEMVVKKRSRRLSTLKSLLDKKG